MRKVWIVYILNLLYTAKIKFAVALLLSSSPNPPDPQVQQYSLTPAQVKDFYRAFAVDRSQADFDMMVGIKNLYLRDIL